MERDIIETGATAGAASAGTDAAARIAAAPDQLGTILRYKADRGYVAYVLAVFALRSALWLVAGPLVCLAAVVPLTALGMFIAPINHHHQHVNTFRAAWLNRLYELLLAVQTGVAPFAWVLHHNLGHHVHYLNQRPHAEADESRWTRADGTQMGRLEYSFDLLLHHQIDILRIGRRYPRILRSFLWMKVPLWGALGAALVLRPLETFLLFLLPAFLTLFHTIWSTYAHHAGCGTEHHEEASHNKESRAYNLLTGNLGLHTAHHKRPGLHWSLLPQLHERIRHRIPPDQIDPSFW